MNQTTNNQLIEFVDDMISMHAKVIDGSYELYVHDLTEKERGEFAYLLLTNNCANELCECFVAMSDSREDEMSSNLLAALLNNDTQSKLKLAETLFKNSIDYFKGSMQRILDARCNDRYKNEMNDNGFYKTQCKQTGEWRYTA
jgi:hypothetical protein